MSIQTLAAFAAACGCETAFAVPLAVLTTFKIGGPAALVITAKPAALPDILRMAEEADIPVLVIGNGSNLLVSDAGFDGVVIRLADDMEPTSNGSDIYCHAGYSLKKLCIFARDRGLSGLEFAYGIPGTAGGALYMNAGAYDGEMAQIVIAAESVSANGVKNWTPEPLRLGYRRSVFMELPQTEMITGVTVRLRQDDKEAIAARMNDFLNRRRAKQPLELPSAGSYFKRPPQRYAAALIESAGLKGFRTGGAMVSEKHAGFVVNAGGATCADVLALEQAVRERVREMHGVLLEREVRYINAEC
ncbi:MAG: UDP-N-acetylmuramate dehydrogenase [Oscillospiraceae bacterium]|nr:UDP-N-acetylmuramate dehydrogenase [Oscillospiraceae bacterium]